MNEVAEMRDAFERIETNLTRFRWVITHPHAAVEVLNKTAPLLDPLAIVQEIDRARNQG